VKRSVYSAPSAVLPKPSCMPVCLSVCDVEVSWSYGLEFFKNNFTTDLLIGLGFFLSVNPTSWIYSKGNTSKMVGE